MTEQAELLDRSVLTNQGKKLVGDSLFYDRIIGYGEAFDNVKMTDSINKNMLTGDYCFYNELTDSAFATKRAVAIDYSQGPDSLFYAWRYIAVGVLQPEYRFRFPVDESLSQGTYVSYGCSGCMRLTGL